MRDRLGCALRAVGVVSALGSGIRDTWPRLVAADQSKLTVRNDLVPGRPLIVGEVHEPLPLITEALRRYACRNNQLALCAIRQIEPEIRAVVESTGAERVGVVMGTSTSGVAAAEAAIAQWARAGALPPEFDIAQLEHGGLAEFASLHAGLRGPAYTISTACSSSAKAIASAQALLALGVCDAVIAGGADSLCQLTTNGFHALQAIADGPSNPFSVNRRGLTLGEGAAVFLLVREPGGIQLVGTGEASDAYHMSAPEPNGDGAERAMRIALKEAEIEPDAVNYLNLHGTGTPLNDSMEGQAVHRVFGSTVPCSSTKPLVGHTLGAAGAIELAFCWMMLTHWRGGVLPLIPHRWDGAADPDLPALHLARAGEQIDVAARAVVMSNSFGFGGNNCALLLSAELSC
jgi:3-oxoacyl-[acyl-carrier-protein] synthase I